MCFIAFPHRDAFNKGPIFPLFPLNTAITVGQDAACQHKGEQADKCGLLFTGSHSAVIDTAIVIKPTNEVRKPRYNKTHH